MSPTVPPTSTRHTSGGSSDMPSTEMWETRSNQSWIASVTWGITWEEGGREGGREGFERLFVVLGCDEIGKKMMGKGSGKGTQRR